MSKPIIGITMGDPSGIGPEITIKAFEDEKLFNECNPVVVGNKYVMDKSFKLVNPQKLQLNYIKDISQAKFSENILNVFDIDIDGIEEFEYGKVSKISGHTAYLCIEKVIELAMENKIDATVTNPLNKEALNLGGHNYMGHTEIYATLTNTKNYSMMLAHDDLRVVHVSTHVSLMEACQRVKKDRVYEVIKLANDACKQLGIKSPKIAVAGLNPHAGENGMFGREEIEEITPAIEKAKSFGMDVDGPVAPDTVFSKAQGGIYDIVVAMYHDQGHIPLKVVGFVYDKEKQKWTDVSGVNITLGLPIIRASVDHGTAFGKAGKGKASQTSLINAIEYAITMVNAK